MQAGHSFLNQIVLYSGTTIKLCEIKLEDKGVPHPWIPNFLSPNNKIELKIESQESNTYKLKVELIASKSSQLQWTVDEVVYHH